VLIEIDEREEDPRNNVDLQIAWKRCVRTDRADMVLSLD
jgi:hypothetical protein